MGWAWATYFIQHAGLHLLMTPQNSGSWIFDKAPGQSLPSSGCLRALHRPFHGRDLWPGGGAADS
eukprot:2882197-Alexandrium_andersonii.AAC.1